MQHATPPEQYCPICGKRTVYTPRYPHALCRECYTLTMDSAGRPVEYCNTGLLGTGCQGYYTGTGRQELYNSGTCYVKGMPCHAEEGCFGGIVIQTIVAK